MHKTAEILTILTVFSDGFLFAAYGVLSNVC